MAAEYRCGILLAAGASRRMSYPKALLPWPASPHLLAHNLAQLLAACSHVTVVLGAQFTLLREATLEAAGWARAEVAEGSPGSRSGALQRLRWVENRGHRRGRASSVRCGVRGLPAAAASGAVACCSVDQPLPPGLLPELFAARRDRAAPVAVPSHTGRRGHPAVFAGRLLGELAAVTEAGEGLREVLERHEERLLEVPVVEPAVLWNLNRPAAYRRAYALWYRPLAAPPGDAGAGSPARETATGSA